MPTEVSVARLKAHLSQYLRAAQQGEEIVVQNRHLPVARLLPLEKPPAKRLVTIPPTRPLSDIDKLPFFRPAKLRPGAADRALRWVRRDRFDKGPL